MSKYEDPSNYCSIEYRAERHEGREYEDRERLLTKIQKYSKRYQHK